MSQSPEVSNSSADFDPREFGRLFRSLTPEKQRQYIASLTPEEAYVIQNTWEVRAREEQLEPEGDWRYWLALCGRGWGKLLCVHTKIPTLEGWKEMGDLRLGDTVFDENGCPTRVTWLSDVQMPDVAYRLHFSDGTTLDACSEHQWVTWTHAERKAYLRSPYEDTSRFPDDWVNWKLKRRSANKTEAAQPRIRLTQELFETQSYGKRSDANHCIPQTRPLQLPHAELPVPPYLLGLWLADGNSDAATITKHQDDLPFLRQQIEAEGFQTSIRSDEQQFGILKALPALRNANVLNNKHIPAIYLRASVEQRLALLQGLLDGDGYVGTNNYCEFSNTNPALVQGVYELLMSLGMRATRKKKIPTLNGVPYTEVELLKFIPTLPVFRLPRKANRLRFDRTQGLRRHHRMIEKIERIESKPMRCISVDSPNSLYLAGEAMIPTHNTETIVQWAHKQAMENPGSVGVMVATVASDVRDVLLEGNSGILVKTPPHERPEYQPTKSTLYWANGSIARLRSADKPDGVRGLNTHWAICDEVASWRRPDTLNQILLGLRLGDHPRMVLATTPKPVRHLKDFLKRKNLHITSGSSYANRANLSAEWFEDIVTSYRGTDIEAQEIDGILLDDTFGALWTSALIDDAFIDPRDLPRSLLRVVVAVDPAVTANVNSNFTGIIVVGMDTKGIFYVLDDLTLKGSPDEWAQAAVGAFRDWQADAIIGEVNNGGDLVEHNIHTADPNVPFIAVRATRGKIMRAEPIVALYQQKRVKHAGVFGMLQSQMIKWTPDQASPDRIDALVWGLTHLAFGEDNSTPSFKQFKVRYHETTNW